MGSHHNILRYLPAGIVVQKLKDEEKINTYFRLLVSGGDEKEFQQLTEYLTSPCEG